MRLSARFLFLPLGLSALALAGCGGGEPVGASVGNLLAFNSTNAPSQPGVIDPYAPIIRSCPQVEVNDGGAAMRVGEGRAVRYQFSLGDVARECSLADGQISIRVGIEGRLLLGPSGSPGSYSAPVHVSIRRESDMKIAATRTYRVSASVPAGESGASYSLVTDNLVVPFIQENADEDYTIVVALADGPAERSARRRR